MRVFLIGYDAKQMVYVSTGAFPQAAPELRTSAPRKPSKYTSLPMSKNRRSSIHIGRFVFHSK